MQQRHEKVDAERQANGQADQWLEHAGASSEPFGGGGISAHQRESCEPDKENNEVDHGSAPVPFWRQT